MSIIWDKKKVLDGLNYIRSFEQLPIVYLKDLLDLYHCESNSLEYYDLVAGDWLFHFIHQVYAAWQENKYENISVNAKSIPVISDIKAYHGDQLQYRFNEYLYCAVANLLEGNTPNNWVFECDTSLISSGSNRLLFSQIVRRMSTNNPDVLLVAPYFKCSRSEWFGVLWQWRHWAAWDDLQYPFSFSVNVDVNWRKAHAIEVGSVSEFTEIIRVLLPLSIPVSLLEGFAEYRKAVLGFPVLRPKVVYSANALHGHLAFKLLFAEWRQQGTLLGYHQHGGGYGLDNIMAIEEYEVRASDRYYTWGWQTDNPHIKQLSAPSLFAPMKIRKRLLLNCVNFPKVMFRMNLHPMPGSVQTMQRETCEFICALPDHKQLMVRPYVEDYGWGFLEMMRKAAPNAVFDDLQKSSFSRFAESRLVVHNYLGTGWLETLALDIPTVCFYDIDTYAFRESAQPYIDAFERIGVLHRSGAAAARFVAALGNDIESWWRKAEIQEARQNFVSRYARFSPDWKEQWEREFSSLIAEAR